MGNQKSEDNGIQALFRELMGTLDQPSPGAMAEAIGRPEGWGRRRMKGTRPDARGVAELVYLCGKDSRIGKLSPREEQAYNALIQDVPEPLERLKKLLLQRKGEGRYEVPPPTLSAEEKKQDLIFIVDDSRVISGEEADQVLAGEAELNGQRLGKEVRFLLTKENWVNIQASHSDAELEDTRDLLIELARRLKNTAQMSDEERKRLVITLSKQLALVKALILSLQEPGQERILSTLSRFFGGKTRK